MPASRTFASDNNAGIHPAILTAITAANEGHARAYGDDRWTAAAVADFRRELGAEAEVFFVMGGTGANVLGLQALLRPFEAVICAACAHIYEDECGAPERFTGSRLLTVSTPDGKLRPEILAPLLRGTGDEHRVQPRVVSITQATELGTVYRPEEIRSLADWAHSHGMWLHCDGARLANAAASLDAPLRTITRDVGVDVLSFGGTKNGLMGGEAVVFFRPELARDFKYLRKQGMQLPSKMRFIAAQFSALLADGLWRQNAAHANRMARRLADGIAEMPQVRVTHPVEANAVFAQLAPRYIPALQEQFYFYVWETSCSEVRWMTSYDTAEADVDAFVAAIREVVARG